MADKGINQPRLRVDRTAPLVLDNTWKTVTLNGATAINTNTFIKDPESGNPIVYYDVANSAFKFYEKYDVNYGVTLYLQITSNIVGSGVTIQYRMLVPNGGGQGINTSFPFPASGGYADVQYVGVKLGSVMNIEKQISMYLSNSIRANGVIFQMRLSEALVGVGNISVTNCAVLIQGIS